MLSGNFCFWHILTVYVSVFHFTRYAFNETLNQRKKKKKHYKPKQCSVSIREEENSGLFSSLDKAHLSSLPNQRCSLPVSRGGKNLCSSMESSPSHSPLHHHVDAHSQVQILFPRNPSHVRELFLPPLQCPFLCNYVCPTTLSSYILHTPTRLERVWGKGLLFIFLHILPWLK